MVETLEWKQYLSGIDYNTKLNIYEVNNKNERFYGGDQWNGVVSNGLPTPVFNLFKRIINYFIASIMSQNIKLQFTPENVGDEPENEEEQLIKDAAELITDYSDTLSEKRKMNQLFRQCLLDAALSGDACVYNWWNMDLETMQKVKGDIDIETIDSVNVMFGDPNNRKVKAQPYILIVSRELVSKLRQEAKDNGVSEDKIKLISHDEEVYYQAGDRAKIELDEKESDTGKTIAILKLWKEDGKVYAKKITKYVTIREKWDTKLSDYPVAWMNWDQRKNSYRGQAVGTGLVPNQIFINKMFAMAMMSLMHTAFPKAIYNKNLIAGWSSQIGTAIGVDGNMVDVGQMAKYLNPGNMSDQVFKLIDMAIQQTKDMLGANDSLLGDINPEQASGRSIIAVQQSASIPLEGIKQNLYQFIEDIGYIWLDFMANHYGKRTVDIEVMGKRQIKEFDFSKLKKMKFRIKVDVGPSSYWSELSAMETLDNLLNADRITFLEYLERIPSGQITQKQELIESRQQEDIKQQFIYEQMARFMEQLPPEISASIQAMEPEEQEQHVMEMMMLPPEELEQHLMQMMQPQDVM
jgi:hypothetical protein